MEKETKKRIKTMVQKIWWNKIGLLLKGTLLGASGLLTWTCVGCTSAQHKWDYSKILVMRRNVLVI